MLNSRFSHYSLAFIGGFATMAIELTSARALAPFFGTSAFIWATVIAVVMCLIFAGNLAGGRLADRGYGLGKLCLVQLIAAVLIPLTSQPVVMLLYACFHQLPENPTVLAGAMVLSVLIISAPVFLLACTSPWLIGILTDGKQKAGGVSGRIYSISTLGGLLGTFLPVLFLVPLIGTRWTFALTSLGLAAAALTVWCFNRRKRPPLAAMGVLAVSLALYIVPLSAQPGTEFYGESLYNSIWIHEDENKIDLLVNDRKAIQSRLFKDPGVLPADVWGLYLTAPLFSQTSRDKRVLLLGLGAGSSAHYFARHFPEYELWGVEIDGVIIEAGKRHFGLDQVPLNIVNADARAFINRTAKRFDIIVVDAFAFPYLPAHLSTVEFMRLLQSRLLKGGVVLFNVGHYRAFNETVQSIAQTGLAVFENAFAYRLSNQMNTLVYFADHPIDQVNLDRQAPPERVLQLARIVRRRLERIDRTGIAVSTDDRPLSEWLTNRIVLQAFGVFGLQSMNEE